MRLSTQNGREPFRSYQITQSKMKRYSAMPSEMVNSTIKNKSMIVLLIRREVIGRYKGSIMGMLWSLFNPIFMLAVYTFVFSVVFQARWTESGESRSAFALVLFVGLIIFNVFSECFCRAPSLILSNVNYVKKVVFPLEVLPVVSLGSALFHALISFVVWLIFFIVYQGAPPVTIILLPAILLPLMFITVGISWMMAAFGVYLRDVSQVVGLVNTALMFLSPIFYPVSAIPEQFKGVLNINPLVPIIEMARNVLIWGKMPDWKYYGAYLICSLLVGWLGFACFQKTRKGFADVL